MKITLFWKDTYWQERGYGKNLWLHIYPDTRSYEVYTSSYSDVSDKSIVESKRKSDIEDLIKYLDDQGYSKIALQKGEEK